MMGGKKLETIQPKTGENHKLFGVRLLKQHNIREPKWVPGDKLVQYSGLARLYEKNQKMENLQETADWKKQQSFLKGMKKKVQDEQHLLHCAYHGDHQRTRNIFQRHKNLQRCYQMMLPHEIIDHIDHKTFKKRKELDRLMYKKKELTEQYETKLINVSEVQDRIKYFDVTEFKEEIAGRSVRVNIKKSETRTRAIRTINQAYRKIIDTMLKDSIFYGPVLNALGDDIKEQERFINKTIMLGIPALENVKHLSNEFENLNNKIQSELHIRIATLLEHRKMLEANNRRVKELVRLDSDFEFDPARYDRDTPSMTNLRVDMKEIELIIQKLANITSVAFPEEIFPRMKKQVRLNNRLFESLVKREYERRAGQERQSHAAVVRETLVNDLTEEELKRLRDIESLNADIKVEKVKQDKLDGDMLRHENMMYLIKKAFQHIVDVARHMGKAYAPKKTPYPSPELTLPLLQFSMVIPKAKPPPPYEGNPEVLINLVKDRVTGLMKKYTKDKPIDDTEAATKEYNAAIIIDLNKGYTRVIEPEEVIEDNIIQDHRILTRTQIKEMSAKIVEANSKKDDF